jgi:hypothetical protein
MKYWSIEESLLLETYYKSGMRIVDMARKLDRSLFSIQNKLSTTDYFSVGRKKNIVNFDIILKNIIKYSGVSKKLLFSKTRKREIIQYRQLCHYYAKEKTLASLATIGECFGYKDHATVLNSCNTIKNLIETDSEFRKIHDKILREINRDIADKESKSVAKVREKQQIFLIKESLNSIHAKIELNDLLKRLKDERRREC